MIIGLADEDGNIIEFYDDNEWYYEIHMMIDAADRECDREQRPVCWLD